MSTEKTLRMSEHNRLAYLEALDAVLGGKGLDADSAFESVLHLRTKLRELSSAG